MDLRRTLFAVAPPIAAAAVGGLGSRDAPTTYARLRKPAWAPPASAFGPAWSALYATIGLAGWRMYPRVSTTSRRLHLAQLGMNAAWPGVFFGIRDKRASLAVIATLDALVVAELWSLRRSDPGSAAILLPYAGWISFATALNAAVGDPGD
ncbi:TspO/MBR family protein [Allobranchiibius sp. CTAmp26]|uniref:TspO/MBR family protein n=1 Tax=Allobranchiibius sp. CTAmp26 TaxID=2815214 RepID=UPI001AA1ADA2|nr:TspO/MBR family protein [Allobranchiibius sp. CTAmp26]MBO1756656.1 tryptophan-rich sensory protein [Allobranchiibius sp. CTAmp26]